MVDLKEILAWVDMAHGSDDDWSSIGTGMHTSSSCAWSDIEPPQPEDVDHGIADPDAEDPDNADAGEASVPDAAVDWYAPLGEAESAPVGDGWAEFWSSPGNDSNDNMGLKYDHYRKLRLHPAELRRRKKSGCCTYCGDEDHVRMTCAAGRLMRKVPKAELNRRLRENVCPLCGDPGQDGHLKLSCPVRETLQASLSKDVYEDGWTKGWASQGPKRNRRRRRGKKPAKLSSRPAHSMEDGGWFAAPETVDHHEDEENDGPNDEDQDLLDVDGPLSRASTTAGETTTASADGTQQATGHLMDADNDLVVCGYLPTLPIVRASQATGIAKPKQKTVTTSHTRKRSGKNKGKGRVTAATSPEGDRQ